ncbi:MAG TPA: tRNA (adenosine(37)-N6)-threonylcarbamoyltransferase complex dimerization subunit type 1 TsaB, partial [Sphingomonas sp.]
WGVPVTGYSSTAIIAATALANSDHTAVAVVIEAGHGEVFVQRYGAEVDVQGTLVSLTPAAAIDVIGSLPVFGNGVARLTAVAPSLVAMHAVPNAADAVLLPAPAADLPPRPIYGRAPDAKLPAEVVVARAAA